MTFEPSQCQAVALDLPKPTHPLVRLRMLISLWGVIREQVRGRHFATSQAKAVESYYEGQLGWRPRQIGRLLEVFQVWARLGREDDQPRLDKFVKDAFGDGAGLEARLKELEGLLDDQIAAVEAAFAEEMQAQERKDAIARDSCLAPEDETGEHAAAPGNGARPGDRPEGENPADHAQRTCPEVGAVREPPLRNRTPTS